MDNTTTIIICITIIISISIIIGKIKSYFYTRDEKILAMQRATERELDEGKKKLEKMEQDARKDIEKKERDMVAQITYNFSTQERQLREREKYCQNIEKVCQESKQTYPWLSNFIAEMDFARDQALADHLEHKLRPAYTAAFKVREIAQEKRALTKYVKELEHQLYYYETVFPWLEEFKDADPKEVWDTIQNTKDEDRTRYDQYKDWLSPSEYATLDETAKLQLALDRYKKREKGNWQIGIEYERYIGYLYEREGYSVQYSGALLGYEDMGRDLIATKDGEVFIIQCKRWAQEKIIHEKHIFQLYGSVVHYLLKNLVPAKGVFITTTRLSIVAKQCAEYLKIEVRERQPIGDYPMIKCNISREGEKIFHLPFDQQYDTVKIEPEKGERYVLTVEEAEKAGFRHAYRWHGE